MPNKDGCINNRTVRQFEYDLLYTDIHGIKNIIRIVGPYWSELRYIYFAKAIRFYLF